MVKFDSYLANYNDNNKNITTITENQTGCIPVATPLPLLYSYTPILLYSYTTKTITTF